MWTLSYWKNQQKRKWQQQIKVEISKGLMLSVISINALWTKTINIDVEIIKMIIITGTDQKWNVPGHHIVGRTEKNTIDHHHTPKIGDITPHTMETEAPTGTKVQLIFLMKTKTNEVTLSNISNINVSIFSRYFSHVYLKFQSFLYVVLSLFF